MKKILSSTAAALVFGLAAAMPARSAPMLVDNVHGYTLADDRLRQFSGIVFDGGKVVATGDAATLRKDFSTAQVIDGGGKTLLDRKSTRLNSSHPRLSRMPSSA